MPRASVNTRSSAIPLALLFAAMILYASLYPFEGWRWPGSPLWSFLWAPLPRYWTWFDVLSNLVGYAPLGFLLALGLLRSGWGRWWALVPVGGVHSTTDLVLTGRPGKAHKNK